MPEWRNLPRTTAFRWSLVIASGFLAMASILFGFIYWQTAVVQRERIDRMIVGEAQHLAALPAADVGSALDEWIAEDLHAARYGGLFAEDGRHLAGNLLAQPADLAADGQASRAVFVGIGRDRDGDDPEVVRAVAQRLADGRRVMLGYDIDEIDVVQDLVVRALGLCVAPAFLLSLLAGVVLARRAQRRIAAIHQAVERIVQGRLAARLPVRGSGDDLDRLTLTVNDMLDQIERLVVELQGVGDNIAHDLRTPLTRLRARLERGREEAVTKQDFRGCIDRAIASVDQTLAVISAILRISEIEHGRRRSKFKAVDLTDVAREALELFEPLADERGVILKLEATAAAPVLGDADLLLEAVGNLLDNALKYAPHHSMVLLIVSEKAGELVLSVLDRGPGIPPAQRDRVLQRFYRLDRSRTVTGNGLGLSLVAAIAGLHGFRVRIEDGQPGCLVSLVCGPAGGATRPPSGAPRSEPAPSAPAAMMLPARAGFFLSAER